jgi:hypothetical protein
LGKCFGGHKFNLKGIGPKMFASLDEDSKDLLFKKVEMNLVCKLCLENFKVLHNLSKIDPERQYFCPGCPVKECSKAIGEFIEIRKDTSKCA